MIINGLGVRILGEMEGEYIRILKMADDIFIGELVEEGYYDKVSQAFAFFLPVKSVGVVGDSRAKPLVKSGIKIECSTINLELLVGVDMKLTYDYATE